MFSRRQNVFILSDDIVDRRRDERNPSGLIVSRESYAKNKLNGCRKKVVVRAENICMKLEYKFSTVNDNTNNLDNSISTEESRE